MRRISAVLVAAAIISTATPASADPVSDAVAATDLSPHELVAAFDDARLAGLESPGAEPSITGDAELDQRIREIAIDRGYRRRGEAERARLVSTDGRLLQPEAAAAWESLQDAMAVAGHSISLTSAYRSSGSQASIFRSRMTGTGDAALDTTLELVAAPGYSKHHTGYAIDVRSGSASLHQFALTPAYAWLADDNWANAKAHGWLPSYPDGVDKIGPNPEPWEFVWVGADNIICAGFDPNDDKPFCDTIGSTFASDISWLHDNELTMGCTAKRYCTDSPVSRGEAATFLWRLLKPPVTASAAQFTDVPEEAFFAQPVAWMSENDITMGTGPDAFSPNTDLTREQFVTFLWRAAGRPTATEPHQFPDVADDSFANDAISWAVANEITNGTGDETFSPDSTATRGQIAAFLRRFAETLEA